MGWARADSLEIFENLGIVEMQKKKKMLCLLCVGIGCPATVEVRPAGRLVRLAVEAGC